MMLEWITLITTGAATGWLGSEISRDNSRWYFLNILIGITGSMGGYWLFNTLGISIQNTITTSLFSSAIGAITFVEVFNFFVKRISFSFSNNGKDTSVNRKIFSLSYKPLTHDKVHRRA